MHPLCLIGIHDWDGNTEPWYPAPRCRRCKRWHSRKLHETDTVNELLRRYETIDMQMMCERLQDERQARKAADQFEMQVADLLSLPAGEDSREIILAEIEALGGTRLSPRDLSIVSLSEERDALAAEVAKLAEQAKQWRLTALRYRKELQNEGMFHGALREAHEALQKRFDQIHGDEPLSKPTPPEKA